jgi:hypothetical protein
LYIYSEKNGIFYKLPFMALYLTLPDGRFIIIVREKIPEIGEKFQGGRKNVGSRYFKEAFCNYFALCPGGELIFLHRTGFCGGRADTDA